MVAMAVEDRKRISVFKAMQRASMVGPSIFTGEEALAEVAKNSGKWNWALVGPNSGSLPLSGGGAGGVEEMRGVISKHPHSFGLLRMAFGFGDLTRTVFIFVHASDALNSGGFSMKERGAAMSIWPAMEAAVNKFTPCTAKVRIQYKAECTVEFLVGKLRAIRGMDSSLFTTAGYYYYNSVLKKASGDEEAEQSQFVLETSTIGSSASDEADSRESKTTYGTPMSMDMPSPVQLHPPASRAASLSHDWSADFAGSVQRRKARAYHVGDLVEIWSVKYDKWIRDGEVMDVVREKCCKDGVNLRAGSVKVLYSSGARFKWMPPKQVSEHLRMSARPKAPDSTIGSLQKECHADVTFWRSMHVEISKGYMQWWEEEAEAERGGKSLGHAYLLGMQLWRQGRSFKLRAESNDGAVFAFQAENDEDAQRWVNALWEHAGHCLDMHELEATVSEKKSLLGGA